jgi:hypothetical protein
MAAIEIILKLCDNGHFGKNAKFGKIGKIGMLGSKYVLKYNLYASSEGRHWHKHFTCCLRRFLPFIFNTHPLEMQPLQRDNNRNKRNDNCSIQMNNTTCKRNNNRDKGTTIVILGRTNVVLIEL